MKPALIQLEQVSKIYPMGQTSVYALRHLSLTIQAGDYVAIVGSSGSGKSTLMNLLGLLDRPTQGQYSLDSVAVSLLNKAQMATLRNRTIGFVFQRFHLLARTPAQRQVELPLFYAGVPARQATQIALQALAQVNLVDRAHHRPEELSGGQQQRVAIARALVNRPRVLLADEPTGALDSQTGQEIMALFESLNQTGLTIILVTHDLSVARRAQRVITLSDGSIINDERKK